MYKSHSSKAGEAFADFDGFENLISSLREAELSVFVNKLLIKKGNFDRGKGHGDILAAALAAGYATGKIVLSGIEKSLADLENNFHSNVIEKDQPRFPYTVDFFKNRPRGISDDIAGRLLDKIYLFGVDEFHFVLGKRLFDAGVIGPGSSWPVEINASNFPAPAGEEGAAGPSGSPGYMVLQYDYYESHDLKLEMKWVSMIERRVLATEWEKVSASEPLPQGGYKVIHRGEAVRWIKDPACRKGQHLAMDRFHAQEREDAKSALEAAKFEGKGRLRLYGTKEGALGALEDWAAAHPHVYLKKQLVDYVRKVKESGGRGRPSFASPEGRYALEACPSKIRYKNSSDLGIPYLVVATNDFSSPAENILRAFAPFRPWSKVPRRPSKQKVKEALLNGIDLRKDFPPSVRKFSGSGDGGAVVTNAAKREAAFCLRSILELLAPAGSLGEEKQA